MAIPRLSFLIMSELLPPSVCLTSLLNSVSLKRPDPPPPTTLDALLIPAKRLSFELLLLEGNYFLVFYCNLSSSSCGDSVSSVGLKKSSSSTVTTFAATNFIRLGLIDSLLVVLVNLNGSTIAVLSAAATRSSWCCACRSEGRVADYIFIEPILVISSGSISIG